MSQPARSRLASFLDLLLVWPRKPEAGGGLVRRCTWGGQLVLGIPSWGRQSSSVRRLAVFGLRTFQGITCRLLLVLLALGGTGYLLVRGSLPPLDGEQTAVGVQEPVTIERDALGVPTIRARSKEDLFFGLGFSHGQDRFFQMDLTRRYAAGELAALLGPQALGVDHETRLHRFRARATAMLNHLHTTDRRLLESYVQGVNAGLASLRCRPWEYYVLRAEPRPWAVEDSLLVIDTMYLMLQAGNFDRELALEVAQHALPPQIFDLIAAVGDEWDAPLEGKPFVTPPLPGPDILDLRRERATLQKAPPDRTFYKFVDPEIAGSNNWAVAGAHTAHGGVLVANDMHLGIRVPGIWYRAALVWTDGSGKEQRAWGATLPGEPGLVVGSNGHLAWGLTNVEGDWSDLVKVEIDPKNPSHYLTPRGSVPFEIHDETIEVKGQPAVTRTIKSTLWGPLLDETARERRYPHALRWVAHDPEALNLEFMKLFDTQTVAEAMVIANRSGGPHVNFIAGDRDGTIGWTILGRIPRRVGLDGMVPRNWSDGKCRWEGYLDPTEYPRIIQPASGRLWTANQRTVEGDNLKMLGLIGYDRGARARQIRDRLFTLEKATEADMLALQRDNRALFLERWQKLLLEVLTPEAIAADPRRGKLRAQVEAWGGRAAKDSIGYRVVHEFRGRVVRATLEPLTARCRIEDSRFGVGYFRMQEGPVWRLVQEKPVHLLDPRYQSWDELLLKIADRVVVVQEKSPDGVTWGERNRADFRHPLSGGLQGIPLVGDWLADQLDMPHEVQDGAWTDMPFIAGRRYGASQRMVVSPGKEDQGYFHIPAGQSGHFLSPHYRDSHAGWFHGEPTPFLPGATQHTLTLRPEK